jgi:hypothetical protein
MIYAVGVRLTDYGARIISLQRGADGLMVKGLAAGPRDEIVSTFLAREELADNGADVRVVIGLGPGDFLTSSFRSESRMSPDEIRSQLRWELEQKIISPSADYNFDFLVNGDRGFGFAGRRKRVANASQSWSRTIIDVEPVSLFNGCESITGLGETTTALVCIESEGITVDIVSRGVPVSMDSVVYRDQGISTVLASLDRTQISDMGKDESARLFEYIRESLDRVTSFGGDIHNPTPQKIILAGAGMYVKSIPELMEKRYAILPLPSDPFSVLLKNASREYPEYTGMGGAFTTGFGLALRALEE